MANVPSFVHLHNHSQYSLLDGHSRISNLVETAQEMGMPAVALTDHGNMFGAVELYQTCKKASKTAGERGLKPIKPIIGMEAYIAPDGKSMYTRERVDGEYGYHLLLLARNLEGYKNLMKLSSKAYLHGFYYRPRIDKDILNQHSAGLMATSTDIGGEIPQYLLKGKKKEAYRLAGMYMDILGPENYYFELQDHGMQEERVINAEIMEMARKFGRPCVATNDIHYVRQQDYKAHDILLCIQTGKKRDEAKRLKFPNDQFYMKSPEEMAAVFQAVCPEALRTTLEIAEKCDLTIPLGSYHFPVFPIPGGRDENEYFRELVYRGLHKRFGDPLPDVVVARAEEELRVICKMGFVGYLLIVWDLIRHAREVGIPVGPGRGSAAGSMVTYALEITNLNPLKYDLLFERFINEGRNEMPDIDIDFCQARRTEMIDYAAQRYGQANVCQIITFGTMAAKMAIRDVGRVMDVPLPEVDRIAKTVPTGPGHKLSKVLDESQEFRAIYNENAVYRELIEMAISVEGLVRQPGTHAAGVIIADKDVTEYAPLYKAPSEEMPCTQYDMKLIDPVGLLKVDFLGLQTLTVIHRAAELVKRTKGIDLQMDEVPLDDPEVYQLFGRGDTNGVFQFESDGMKKMLRQARPDRLEDLIALNAMYRPGPMDNINSFVRRKHGEEEVEYLHPDLEPILTSTYGIIVYQEQVMLIASKLAGFSLSEADKLRKAMGKKKKDLMAEYRVLFLKGAKERGYDEAVAVQVYDLIEKFAEYGFNKSHSAAYAFLAYQTAYLKAKFPTQFMAAVLTLDMGNTDKVAEYIEESKRMGLAVAGPGVNESDVGFSVPRDGEIRYALAAIKGVGVRAMEELVLERKKNGPFSGIYDLCERLDSKVINKTTLQHLVKAGAFDAFGTRSQHLAVAEKAIAMGTARNRDRAIGQGTLFDLFESGGPDGPGEENEGSELPPIDEWDSVRISEEEKEVMGFYFSHHPLDAHRGLVLQLSSHPVQSISAIDDDGYPVVPEGTAVTIGGMISSLRKTYTKKQQPMGILRMEGLGNASCEAVAFPSAYEKYQELLIPDALVFLQGVVRQNAQGVSLAIENVVPMDEARARLVDYTTIDLTGVDSDQFDDVLERIRSVCSMNPGNSVLHIRMTTMDGATALVQAGDDYRILPSESLEEVVQNLAGRNSFFLIPRVFEAPAQWNGKRGFYRGNGNPVKANQPPNSAPAASMGGENEG